METVESPLDVLSRAATMVQHCYQEDQADDAENASSNSCESKSNAAVPEKKSLSASVKFMSKRRKGRAFSPRFRNLYTKDVNTLGNKAARSHSFNDKSTVPKALNEQITALRNNSKLHHSDTDISNQDESNDYSDSDSGLTPSKNSKLPEYTESPIDMSVKMKSSPPPYSQSVNNSVHRPSVITQASNKISPSGHPVSPTLHRYEGGKPDIGGKGEYIPGSVSMCDPVIDEHFRRSLGENYMTLFGKSKETSPPVPAGGRAPTKDRGSSPIMFPRDPCIKYLIPNPKYGKTPSVKSECDESDKPESKMDVDETSGLTVDDHFAKALGDAWMKLKDKPAEKVECSEK